MLNEEILARNKAANIALLNRSFNGLFAIQRAPVDENEVRRNCYGEEISKTAVNPVEVDAGTAIPENLDKILSMMSLLMAQIQKLKALKVGQRELRHGYHQVLNNHFQRQQFCLIAWVSMFQARPTRWRSVKS
jgi:hypothetical protein